MEDLKNIIKKLNLKPHPEGGYFKETYRSKGIINPESLDISFTSNRNYSTCIYFLLTSDTFSAFHKIKQDEIWHFYKGSPIILHTISEQGKHQEYHIGNDFSKNQVPQLVVPAGYLFAAKTLSNNNYSLVGCTVSPGFDFEDFELPKRKELIAKFPQHENLIKQFTRE